MFTIDSVDGDARCGTLSLNGGREIITPALLVYTRRGGALNLTPDLIESLEPEAQALQLSVLQFLDNSKGLKQFPGTAREYLGIDPSLAVVATARDPCIYEYHGALRQSTDQWASVGTVGGAKTVSPEEYMETAAALQPDILVMLSDEIPCDSKRDRTVVSVDRSLKWLERCLPLAAASPGTASAALFASVQGAQFLDQRKRFAEGLGPYMSAVAGICVSGLGTGESSQLRHQLISEVLSHFPATNVRMAASLGTPEDVVAAVHQGIDLLDVSYVADVTAGGYALTFPVSPEEEEEDEKKDGSLNSSLNGTRNGIPGGKKEKKDFSSTNGEVVQSNADRAAALGADDMKINLWAGGYSTDARPLVVGCTCLACTAHTRAYVHHLLESHEMTAQVLLEAHNTAHYLRFFTAMRRAIAGGKFGEYVEWMQGRKQRWLMGLGAV